MLAPNTILQNRYLVVRQLSMGGMGAVYLVKHQRLGKFFALKETFFSDDNLLRRAFEREAQLLANLDHPALPKVTDHFTEDDTQFLLMEYIPGEDLGTQLKSRNCPFTPAEVLEWADQLLDALDYLHTHEPPIIHRDIKPENLKLTQRNKIILLDFGLAKGSTSEMSHVSRSIFGFTPNYAPLEQVQGEGTDARSDLYSFAATFYHLITGVVPPSVMARIAAIADGLSDPLRPASELNSDVPSAVAAVLHQAMARNRDQRPPSAAAMREAIRRSLQSTLPGSASPDLDVIESRYIATVEPDKVSLVAELRKQQESELRPTVPSQKLKISASQQQAFNSPASPVQNTIMSAPLIETATPRRELRAPEMQHSKIWLVVAAFVAIMGFVIAANWGLLSSKYNPTVNPAKTTRETSRVSAMPPLKSYQFDTVMIDASGRVIQQGKGQAQYFSEELGDGVTLEMVEIPNGTFFMGSPNTEVNHESREEPLHQVKIPSLYVGKFEVTQAQWRSVARLPRVSRDLSPDPSQFKGTNLPVERVSWSEAQEFCARLSQKTGKVYRLPSEAEWEYACRAGTTTPFPFGDTITSELVNYNGAKPYREAPTGLFRKRTTPVGNFPVANRFGLYDMIGNVWEWCLDLYNDNYYGAPIDGSAWESGNDPGHHVRRGGSWYNSARYLRSAGNGGNDDPHLDGHGLRVVATGQR